MELILNSIVHTIYLPIALITYCEFPKSTARRDSRSRQRRRLGYIFKFKFSLKKVCFFSRKNVT